MTDLEKALEYVDSVVWSHDEPLLAVLDAARRFANLTSPETIEKGAKALSRSFGYRESAWRRWAVAAEAVLRSVEEVNDVSAK